MKFFPLVMLAVFAACKKETAKTDPVPVKEVVSGVAMIDYDAPERTYSCRAPGEWKADERNERFGVDTVSFFGPLEGPRPFSVFINIMKYPPKNGDAADAEKFAESFWEFTPDAKPPKREIVEVAGRKVIRFAIERPYVPPHAAKAKYIERWDFALIPVKDGFFRLQHKAPKDDYMKTLPVFEAMVRSFKPKES